MVLNLRASHMVASISCTKSTIILLLAKVNLWEGLELLTRPWFLSPVRSFPPGCGGRRDRSAGARWGSASLRTRNQLWRPWRAGRPSAQTWPCHQRQSYHQDGTGNEEDETWPTKAQHKDHGACFQDDTRWQCLVTRTCQFCLSLCRNLPLLFIELLFPWDFSCSANFFNCIPDNKLCNGVFL